MQLAFEGDLNDDRQVQIIRTHMIVIWWVPVLMTVVTAVTETDRDSLTGMKLASESLNNSVNQDVLTTSVALYYKDSDLGCIYTRKVR